MVDERKGFLHFGIAFGDELWVLEARTESDLTWRVVCIAPTEDDAQEPMWSGGDPIWPGHQFRTRRFVAVTGKA